MLKKTGPAGWQGGGMSLRPRRGLLSMWDDPFCGGALLVVGCLAASLGSARWTPAPRPSLAVTTQNASRQGFLGAVKGPPFEGPMSSRGERESAIREIISLQ